MLFHSIEQGLISGVREEGVFYNKGVQEDLGEAQGGLELSFGTRLFNSIMRSTNVLEVPVADDSRNKVTEGSRGLSDVVEANSEDGRVEHHVTVERLVEHDGIINVNGFARNMKHMNT